MIEAERVAELMGEDAGVGIAIDPHARRGAADRGHARELAVGVEREGVDLAHVRREVDAGGGRGLARLGLDERDVAAGGGDAAACTSRRRRWRARFAGRRPLGTRCRARA